MYSNLTLYYLKQLGIRPWVTKARNLDQKKPVFVLCKSTQIMGKAESLLKQILFSMGFTDNDLVTLVIKEKASSLEQQQYSLLLRDKQVLAWMCAGIEPIELINNLSLPCENPIELSLESLLKNPALKKQVFKELMQIRQLTIQ